VGETSSIDSGQTGLALCLEAADPVARDGRGFFV
jgi:hypothetical protein